jgi:serine/threonine-protein kinase HipA
VAPPPEINTVAVTVEIDGDEVLVGAIRVPRRHGQSVGFQYDEGYLASSRSYPLEPALPLQSGYFQPPEGKLVFNAFSDTAPDRWGKNLMRRQEKDRAQEAGTTPRVLGDVDFLLGVHDELRQGAVRYGSTDLEEHYSSDESGVPKIVTLPRLLAASDSYIEGGDADLRDLFAAGGSLGGARPKAALRDRGGKLILAKFSRRDDEWDIVAFERTQHVLAGRAGIDVTRSELVHPDGRSVLLVERFDREGDQRVGFMSALTALEASDMDTRSYLELAEVIERNTSAATEDLEQLFRRVAFQILTSNTDDHLRNHGLLRRGREWRLSPEYDLNPNPEQTGHLQMAVDIDDTSADIELACSVAGYYRLGPARAKEIIGEVEAATRGWRAVAGQHGIGRRDIDLMAQAYETPQREFARQLASQTTAVRHGMESNEQQDVAQGRLEEAVRQGNTTAGPGVGTYACPVVLKSGPREGLPCGRRVRAGHRCQWHEWWAPKA